MDTDGLIRTGMRLRAQIAALKVELEAVNLALARRARFAPGKATAYVEGEGCRARVVARSYEKWDQTKLNAARAAMGDGAFLHLFKYVWEPVSKRSLSGFLDNAPREQTALVRAALSTRTIPVVTFEEGSCDADA